MAISSAGGSANERAPILKMPTEILDKIVSCLPPGPKDITWLDIREGDRTKIFEDYCEAQLQAKQDYASVRLVCRKLSASKAALDGLFETFHFLPTTNSVNRLVEVARHSNFALIVKILVFYKSAEFVRRSTALPDTLQSR